MSAPTAAFVCFGAENGADMFVAKDISGMRFGKLTAVEPISRDKDRKTVWLCSCDCGNTTSVPVNALTSGNTKSCGCLRNGGTAKGGYGSGKSRPDDLAGRRFGLLTALSRCGRNKDRNALWECVCDCGVHVVRSSKWLKTAKNQSCGCAKTTEHHDAEDERLYKVWAGIKQRCVNPKHTSFKWYGGRGIKMCDEWSNSFLAFKRWADKTGYDRNAPRGAYTVDRIDPNGDYEPANCRWLTIAEQQGNKR